MTDANLPGIEPLQSFTLLTELELQTIRKQLIELNGDLDKAGVSLETMRNVIYSCRMKANPMQDNPAEPKPRREKKESTNKVKVSGDDINNFLG